MSAIARLTGNDIVELPADVARRFHPQDRFLVWVEGETIHLRRLGRSPLDLVEEAPDADPLSLAEINDIVHEVRRARSNNA